MNKLAMVAARRHSRAQRLLISLLTMFCACQARGAPQGELDPQFGQHGRLTVQEDARLGGAMLQQPADGKLLFPGYFVTDGVAQGFAVLRLNADGTRDTTFGTNGLVTVESGGFANRLALQPDGRIIVAGTVGTGGERLGFALARLNADGTIDSTFGTDGLVTLDLNGYDSISDIVLLQDGRFVVAGTTPTPGAMVAVFARFDSNGALDATFGTGPVAGTTLVSVEGRSSEIFSLVRQPDGKFVACGAASDSSEFVYIADMLAIRVTEDGLPDTTYGTDGIARIAISNDFASAQACTAMPDGGLIMAGFHGEPGIVNPTLVRLTPDGTLNTAFGKAGIATFTAGPIAWLQSILRLADGSLGVAGFTGQLQISYVPSYMLFAHVDADTGALDATFGNEGVTIVDFGQGDQPSGVEGRGLIEQADGKLIAAGYDSYSSLAVARVDRGGTGSSGFVGVASTAASVTEGNELVVEVRRTGGSIGTLSVNYSTVADGATSPADYAAASGTLTWLEGETASKSIVVSVADDDDHENSERFSVLLSGSTGPLAADAIEVQIKDDDPAPTAPEPPVAPDSNGGGGAFNAGTLLILASMGAVAIHRRRRALHRPRRSR